MYSFFEYQFILFNINNIGDDLQFRDWEYGDTLFYSIKTLIRETNSDYDELKNHRFDLNGNNFMNIVKTIPYILIERLYACLCFFCFQNCFSTFQYQ